MDENENENKLCGRGGENENEFNLFLYLFFNTVSSHDSETITTRSGTQGYDGRVRWAPWPPFHHRDRARFWGKFGRR